MAVRLSAMEAQLWRRLIQSPGTAVSHRDLIAVIFRLRRSPIFPTNRQMGVLRQMISRLRKKVERDPALPDHILTHRGVGYSFEP